MDGPPRRVVRRPDAASQKQVKIIVEDRCMGPCITKSIKWLWKYRVPAGKLTIFAGRPGTGKSTLSHNIATRLSTGLPFPDAGGWACEPGQTIIISEEDSPEEIINPRLDMMKADKWKIFVWTTIRMGGERVRVNLVDHLYIIEQYIKDKGDVKLLILDTIESFMGPKDTHKNSEVRSTLDPLLAMAERTGVAVIGITHLNKATKENRAAIDRVIGSVGYTGAARMVWLLAHDEEDKDLIKMVMVKSNVCKNPGGIAYKLQNVMATADDGSDVETTLISFQEGIVRDDPNALSQADSRAQKLRDFCSEWLQHLLKKRAWLTQTVIITGLKEGYSKATIYRAAKKLKVESFDHEEPSSGKVLKYWKLPDSHN